MDYIFNSNNNGSLLHMRFTILKLSREVQNGLVDNLKENKADKIVSILVADYWWHFIMTLRKE